MVTLLHFSTWVQGFLHDTSEGERELHSCVFVCVFWTFLSKNPHIHSLSLCNNTPQNTSFVLFLAVCHCLWHMRSRASFILSMLIISYFLLSSLWPQRRQRFSKVQHDLLSVTRSWFSSIGPCSTHDDHKNCPIKSYMSEVSVNVKQTRTNKATIDNFFLSMNQMKQTTGVNDS